MINARANLNGNSTKDFTNAALRLSKALAEVDEALANVRANVFHGRNYQTVPEHQRVSARAGDDLQMKIAQDNVNDVLFLAKQIIRVVVDQDEVST